MERDEFVRHMQESQRYALQANRLLVRLQVVAIAMIVVGLLGMAWLIWHHVGQTQARLAGSRDVWF